MRVVVQRVKEARVLVADKEISKINKGLLLLVGIGKEDADTDIDDIANKIKRLRIFEDTNEKMNLNIKQIDGEILSVSQFTLYADTRKGNRPGFEQAASPEAAENLWKRFNSLLAEDGIIVKEGRFGAKMQIDFINDGPVTIVLDSKEK